VLGDQIGQASEFKMLMAAFSKGLATLFMEVGLCAHGAGVADQLIGCIREAYPAVMAAVDRMVPTYAQHAARRADEMSEVVQTMLAMGVQPPMTEAAAQLLRAVGRVPFPSENLNTEAVLETLYRHNPIAAADAIVK
jgi:hypothetical protein